MPFGSGGEFIGSRGTSPGGTPGPQGPAGPQGAQGAPGTPSVQWVDLGMVDLATALMDGPQTLYNMPEGSFLSQIRFTDDPATVPMDTLPPTPGSSTLENLYMVFGTEKSFGWLGFAWIGGINLSGDTLFNPAQGFGYGPFAALDTGLADSDSQVLSAASVGPIQAGWRLGASTVGPSSSLGGGVRVAPIVAWAADTAYQSPESNTVATPGVLQKAAIVANGTIWLNGGATGTSGGTAPDFAGNAGGSVADGADIVWYDTATAPPTVGTVHVVAEIVTPVAP